MDFLVLEASLTFLKSIIIPPYLMADLHINLTQCDFFFPSLAAEIHRCQTLTKLSSSLKDVCPPESQTNQL